MVRPFTSLILTVAVERLLELRVSRRNAAWARARGGREFGASHYPWMVALHVALLAGSFLEVSLLRRPFCRWLGGPALGLVIASQALRWTCVGALGRRWNTRVIVIPGSRRLRRGPYRWLRHPNYLAVAVEGAALPLVHSAWLTAFAFTALDTVLLRHRVRVEEAALAWAETTSPVGIEEDTARGRAEVALCGLRGAETRDAAPCRAEGVAG